MSFSLFPKSPKFFELFREQNRIIVDAAAALEVIVEKGGDCDDQCQVVNRLEWEGDKINREIARCLSTTFITPIDREDIHDLNVSQETILNHIQAISVRIGVFGFGSIRFSVRRTVSNLKLMLTEIGVLLAKLAKKQQIEKDVKYIKQIKDECEMLIMTGLAELYDEQSTNPTDILDILKWTQVYDRIDKAMLRTWNLAKIIEGIALKNA